MGLCETKHCQFELKGTEMGQNEERLLNFLDLTGWDHRPTWLLKMHYSPRGRNGPKGNSEIIAGLKIGEVMFIIYLIGFMFIMYLISFLFKIT